MRKPISISAVIVASLAALGSSHAAPAASDCLSSPNGAAPSGQHWYYHLDRANHRKCWYLRDAAVAAPPAAAKPSAAATPAPRSELRQAASERSNSSHGATMVAPAAGQDTAATSAPTPGDTASAAPLNAASDPAPTQNSTTGWPDPPPAAATPDARVTDAAADAPLPDAAAAPAIDKTAPSPSAGNEAAVPHAAVPVSATAPGSASPSGLAGLADTVLVSALAALVAATIVGLFFVLRRRRRTVRIDPGEFVPRFGSRADRRDGGWLKLPKRAAPPLQAAPIQDSLIPEQARVTRPFTRPR